MSFQIRTAENINKADCGEQHEATVANKHEGENMYPTINMKASGKKLGKIMKSR